MPQFFYHELKLEHATNLTNSKILHERNGRTVRSKCVMKVVFSASIYVRVTVSRGLNILIRILIRSQSKKKCDFCDIAALIILSWEVICELIEVPASIYDRKRAA